MKSNVVASQDAIAAYVKQVAAGLKSVSESQRQEIVAEIRSHLDERVQQFAGQDFAQPEDAAIAAMGDADELARQFARTASAKTASRSFAPWVLLHAAAGLAFTGIKGSLTFLLGLIGYGIAVAFTFAAIMKLIMPSKIGFWVGPHLLVWGMSPATPDRNELAGRYFTFVSVAMAFLFASGTTLALRWLTQSKLWQQSVLRRMTR